MPSLLNNRKRSVWRLALMLLTFAKSHSAFAAACWTDADLLALEETQANAVVYVWSPRMVLSVLHADDVAKQARESGLRFVPIVDGRVPEAEWRLALSAIATKAPINQSGLGQSLQSTINACASRLTALDAYQHFPSVFLIRSGRLQPEKWTGAMNSSTWADAFQQALKLPPAPIGVNFKPQFIDSISTSSGIAQVVQADGANNFSSDTSCVATNQFISLPPELAGRGTDQAVALGAYERISPDGRFVLRSYSGKSLSAVSLMELPAPALQAKQHASTVTAITQTPLSNEAFPVQGSWRYIVDTNGQHYAFSDLLKLNKQARPYFQGGMSGFYAAAAEVGSSYPVRSLHPVQIRSLSWPNPSSDSETTGEGMLTARTITVEPRQHQLLGDSGRVNLCLGRVGIDGNLYSLPMISVDGYYFSALPQRPVNHVATMRIFGFGLDGKQCLPEQQFSSPSGKVTFGFSTNKQADTSLQSPADLVYEYRGQVWWYASQMSTAFNLAPVEDRPSNPKEPYRQKIIASAFPGLTRDGRVIYAATWQLCTGANCEDEAGYIASDPYQSNAYQQHLLSRTGMSSVVKATAACITTRDVLRERADFANFHGIAIK